MKKSPLRLVKKKPSMPLLPEGERADYIALVSTPNSTILKSPTDGKTFLADIDACDAIISEIVTIESLGRSQRFPVMKARVLKRRIDASAMGLTPLRIIQRGTWDPAAKEWFTDEDWAKPIIERGVWPEYTLENVVPSKRANPFFDAVEMYQGGMVGEARGLMRGLLIKDLRCLDAHAHLGNFAFDDEVEVAIRHYEVGLRIGDLTVGTMFDGVLPWGRLDNRPYLRCLHGYGLCLWRLRRRDEAKAAFERLLWLNPSDNQGARDCRAAVKAGEKWVADLDPLLHIALQ